jgi:hypothetical protein
VQLVAGVVCLTAIAWFGWTSTRLATYSAPWSAPWEIGSVGGLWPATNAAIRFVALAAVAAVIAWPYFQGGVRVSGVTPREVFKGFRPQVDPASGDVTWLLIVVAIAGSIAVGLLVVWLLPALRHRQRIARSQAPIADEEPTLSELSDESLQAMISESDPRRAILASYARMERRLASRGVPRNPEETALEYMRRLLERAGAPEAPLRSLTGLFHLAGFSSQAIDESMRESAIRALTAIGAGAR